MPEEIFKLSFTPVNGQRVRQARELRGLTQSALADLLGVDQTMVAHIERGTKQPSAEVLEHLSTELELPEPFFRQPNPPDFPTGSLLFRSKSGVGKRIIAQVHSHASLVFEFAMRLAERASLIPVRLPLGDDPMVAARNVRLAMKAPDGPLPNVTRAIERLGVLVLPLPDFRDCDAFAVWAGPGREYPVIGIIGQKPPDRVRMSLTHELGHLVLHRSVASGTQELETHAYQFAAELLMPAKTITRDLAAQKLNLFRLAELKGTWGVSMQALSRRARELDVINDRQYRYLMKQLSLRGWRADEPNLTTLALERPRAIRKLGEVTLGLSPNWKNVARDFTLTDSFLSDLFQMSEPAPSARARTNSAPTHGEVLTFKRRA
jgi:Zn-dependent peptidase ImmA (M78 family)/transcriptional regulator with XRE-family HTH domain